jgi:6-phosphogluconolactonase (cycloisomerase 2 family)
VPTYEGRGLPSGKACWRAGLAAGVALFAFCPTALAAKASTAAYVVDNSDNTIIQYTVGANGTLAPDTPATVATGLSPTSLALSADGKSAYVANDLASETTPNNQGTISQYNVAANGTLTPKDVATVYTGAIPLVVATDPDGKSVYVLTDQGVYQYSVGPNGSLSPISPATVNVGLGQPEGMVVSPDGKSVYVLTGRADSPSSDYAGPGLVRQFSVAANGALIPKTPAYVLVGPTPVSIAVGANGKSLYVTNTDYGSYDGGIGSISQFAIAPNGTLTPDVPATVSTGSSYYDPDSFPNYIAINPDGYSATVLTAGFPPSAILRYSIAPNGTLSTSKVSLPFASFPLDAGTAEAAAYSADGKYAYVTNLGGGFVAGSGYNVGSDGPPVVSQYINADSETMGLGSPSEVLTAVPFTTNPFPYEIVLNNQPQLDGE